MSNALDKNYSQIVDNTESVDLTKELDKRLRAKTQIEMIKSAEEKDEKLLKLANETNSKNAPFSHAPMSRLTNKNSELDKKDMKAYHDDFQKFLQEEGLKTESSDINVLYTQMFKFYEQQRKLKAVGVEPPGLFKTILNSIEDLNKKNDENKKLIEQYRAEFANEKSEAKNGDLFNEIKTDMNCMKSFFEKEGLTSRTKAPAKIETIPTFIDVVEHIPEDKMPNVVYFLVPDLTLKDDVIAKYRYINMNCLPQELKRVINATLNFMSHGSDKRMLVDYCKSLLESAEKIDT